MLKVCVRVAAVIWFCWLWLGVASADDPKPGSAITTVGDHKLFDGKLSVSVSEKEGNLTYRITHPVKAGKNTISPAKDLKKENAVWVIFAESPNKVWIYWDSVLTRYEYKVTERGTESSSAVFTGEAILKSAPKAVLDRLPKQVVDKLKGK
jgi:hypothetical protein